MNTKDKYIGQAPIKEEPKKPFLFRLADKCIKWKHLSDEVAGKINKVDDLQNQIDSLNKDEYGRYGIAVSNQFGDNPRIGISQKTLTEAFHHFYQILSDITGEVYEGFSMAVTPDYYVGESGCTVTITASTLTTVGKFERIAFYWNSEEEPFLYREDVYGIDGIEVELPLDKLLDDQIIIRCKAKILGQVYTEQKAIRHCDSLWLGAGSQATDVMVPANLIPASHHMRGAYDVSVSQGQHIIVVVGEALASGFIRADINGVEIDMTESTITQDGNTYKVFTSVNTYQAGTYNIDING